MRQSDHNAKPVEGFLGRMGILVLACGFGFACGGTVNPSGTALIKVTAKTSPRPSETPAQATPSIRDETALPDSTEKTAAPETFHDDFDEPAGWAEDQTDRYSMGRGEGGIYRIEFYLAGDEQLLLSLQPHSFALPLRDMDVRREGTAMDENGAYGLVCRYADPSNYYTIHISLDGRYWFYKQVNGRWTDFGSGTSDAIQEQNTIELQCVGDTISASVNGELLAEVRDGSLAEGNAGLFSQPLGGPVAGTWSYYAAFQVFEMIVYP
jgi:hypothetical protein